MKKEKMFPAQVNTCVTPELKARLLHLKRQGVDIGDLCRMGLEWATKEAEERLEGQAS